MHAAVGVINRERVAAAVVLLTAAAVRFLGVGAQPLWWDEGWSVYFASLPVDRMLDATASDIHPPLYYLALHLWASVFGFSPVALRTLSAVAGLATVWVGWRLGRLLLGRTAGMVAALLLTLSPLQTFYSQEVRMYSLVTALGLLSWLALLHSGVGRPWPGTASTRRRTVWLAVYVGATTLALYTEYYAALLWLSHVGYVLLSQTGEPLRKLRRQLVPLAGPPLLFLPWLVYALPRLLHYVSQKQSIEGYHAFDPITFAWDHLSAFAAGHSLSPSLALLTGTATVLLAGLAVTGWFRARSRPGLRLVLAVYGLLPLALGYVVHVLFPFTPRFYERVMLPFSPPLYLAAAYGLVSLARQTTRWPVARATFAAVAVLLPTINLLPLWTLPRNQGTDYRPLFATIRRLGSAQDVILCIHPWQYGYAVAYLPPRLRHPTLVPTDRWADPAIRADELATLLAGSRALWFPSHESLGRILESEIAADLHQMGAQAHAGWLDGDTLLLAYTQTDSALTPGAAGGFRDGPALVSSRFADHTQSGSGTIPVQLDWGASAAAKGLEASLRLVDGLGHTWASRDFIVKESSESHSILVPWGTPAIPLQLTLTLARAGVELQPDSESEGARSLTLGTVQVLPPSEAPPPVTDLGAECLEARFDLGMVLLGRDPWPQVVTQGDEVPVTLWWSITTPLQQEPILFVQALDPYGQVVAAAERRITLGLWPPSNWPAGMPVRDPQPLLLPADAPVGHLTLVAGLLDPESRQRIALAESDMVILGQVEVAAADRTFVPPKLANAADIAFGDVARLVGYELSGCDSLTLECLAEQDELEVRLAWQANRSTGTHYRSFVHLTCGGEIVAQSDQEPGGASTTAWLPGQYADDRHRLALDRARACQDVLSLHVGLYDPATGQRLVPGSGDQEDGKLVLIGQERP